MPPKSEKKAGGKREGAGRPKKDKPSEDDEPPTKKIKKTASFEDSNPKGYALMERLFGVIDTVKDSVEGEIAQEVFNKAIHKQLANPSTASVITDLHHHLVEKKASRDILIDAKREQLRHDRKKAKSDDIVYQTEIHTKIGTMNKDELKQLKRFLQSAITHCDFVSLTSPKLNTVMESEGIICLAFDALNDQKEQSRRSVPTNNGSSQQHDDNDDDSDSDSSSSSSGSSRTTQP